MIPARFAPLAVALITSGVMSCMVSGLSILRATGAVPGFFGVWMGAWVFAWAIAFPLLALVAPLARRFVARLTRPDGG
ncbi:MAG: DUF2798 domain-containing protein [Pseudomonadota bacterium]